MDNSSVHGSPGRLLLLSMALLAARRTADKAKREMEEELYRK